MSWTDWEVLSTWFVGTKTGHYMLFTMFVAITRLCSLEDRGKNRVSCVRTMWVLQKHSSSSHAFETANLLMIRFFYVNSSKVVHVYCISNKYIVFLFINFVVFCFISLVLLWFYLLGLDIWIRWNTCKGYKVDGNQELQSWRMYMKYLLLRYLDKWYMCSSINHL